MKTAGREIETYNFEILKPFDRGEVIGGFGYFVYKDATQNRLILIPKSSFDKSKGKAQTQTFWTPYPEEMQMVVLVRRVTAALKIDPEKVNASYMKVEIDETSENAERDADENANKGEFIDIDPVTGEPVDPKEAWRNEWINKKNGFPEYVRENAKEIQEKGKVWPDLYNYMRSVKWPKHSTEPWPLVEQADSEGKKTGGSSVMVMCQIRRQEQDASVCESPMCAEIDHCVNLKEALAANAPEDDNRVWFACPKFNIRVTKGNCRKPGWCGVAKDCAELKKQEGVTDPPEEEQAGDGTGGGTPPRTF